jgi:hypothetical protein
MRFPQDPLPKVFFERSFRIRPEFCYFEAMEAWEVFQEIQQSEGHKIYWKMQELQATYSIFSGNFEELLNAIASFETPAVSKQFMSADRSEALREVQRKILRLLHNFLAGANTLIDHTRVLTTELYAETPFNGEYQAKVKEIFGDAPITRFVKGLRNWMVHRGLVPVAVVSTLGVRDESSTSRLVLILADLKCWDRWDASAKTYLAEHSTDVSLEVLVRSYASLVEGFYAWLGTRLGEVHADAFAELQRLQERYKSARPFV